MNAVLEAAWEVHQFLSEVGAPYVMIGGLAVQHWGEPRITANVDVTVAVHPDQTREFLERAVARFAPRIPDAVDFAERNRVVLLAAGNGCPIDVSLAIPGYEEEVMRRAVACELAPGRRLRLCSPEDLLVHKWVAGRPRDLEDARSVMARQKEVLDIGYIRRWLAEFASALDRPDLLDTFEAAWAAAQRD